jgi:hypothetical protein
MIALERDDVYLWRIALDRVEVDFEAERPICLHATLGEGTALGEETRSERFTVGDLVPQKDFCGAFAVREPRLPNVRHRQWFNPL